MVVVQLACQTMQVFPKEESVDLEGLYIWTFLNSFLLRYLPNCPSMTLSWMACCPCSGSQPAVITSTTVEVVVPRALVPSIYGEDGGCLKKIRQVCIIDLLWLRTWMWSCWCDIWPVKFFQISGAKITITEPRPGATETAIIISGAPEETHAAQSLLQAFVMSGTDSTWFGGVCRYFFSKFSIPLDLYAWAYSVVRGNDMHSLMLDAKVVTNYCYSNLNFGKDPVDHIFVYLLCTFISICDIQMIQWTICLLNILCKHTILKIISKIAWAEWFCHRLWTSPNVMNCCSEVF